MQSFFAVACRAFCTLGCITLKDTEPHKIIAEIKLEVMSSANPRTVMFRIMSLGMVLWQLYTCKIWLEMYMQHSCDLDHNYPIRLQLCEVSFDPNFMPGNLAMC